MQNYRFTILGAGLAGLSLSAEFSIRSIPHTIIDTGQIGSGASGTPAGLLNPASAQKAKFPATAPTCIDAFEKLYNSVSACVDCSNVILNNHILRPALDEKLASNFRDSVENGGWPKDWVTWLNEKEVKEYGNIQSLGAMFIKKGLAIDFRSWTTALAEFSTSKQAFIIENTEYEIKRGKQGYIINTDSDNIQTDVIIDCTGASERFKSHFKWHPVKGQTRSVIPLESIVLNTAVSGYGYVVKVNDQLILGSTYEHQFDTDQPTLDKDRYLLKKASMVTKESFSVNQITQRWAGIRVSTPDRLPAIGSLSTESTFHYILGLGSKGLYYSAWLAKMLADHLINGITIPEQYHVNRLKR